MCQPFSHIHVPTIFFMNIKGYKSHAEFGHKSFMTYMDICIHQTAAVTKATTLFGTHISFTKIYRKKVWANLSSKS